MSFLSGIISEAPAKLNKVCECYNLYETSDTAIRMPKETKGKGKNPSVHSK